MDIEELANRLASLESGFGAEQQQKQQAAFMDKYGSKFSGDEGLGVAILGELSRRGVDTSAADEAVTTILDQLRQEATALLDKIKLEQNQVSDLMDKVNAIDESVQAAGGALPPVGGNMGAVAPDGALPGPQIPGAEGLPPEGGVPEGLPPEIASPEGVSAEGAIPEAPVDGTLPPEGVPPESEAPVAEPEIPPAPNPKQMLSDARLKILKSRLQKPKPKTATTVVSDKRVKNVWRPPVSFIAAARAKT
jgi:hypothetical protein